MSTDALVTLTYTSRAKLDLTARDLVAIHQAARHFNALDGVTGLLIFNGVFFLQIIEGARGAIDSLLDRLLHDTRHTSLEVRDRRGIEQRQFPSWSMELVQVSTQWQEARVEIERVLPETVNPAVRTLIRRLDASDGSVRLLD